MRVAVIGTRGIPGRQGGVEQHAEHIYVRLAENPDLDIRVYCRRPFGVHADGRREWKGIELRTLPTFRRRGLEALWHSFAATLHALASNADLLHYHNIGPALFAPLARLFRRKVVVTYHSRNYEHDRWGPLAVWLLRLGEAMAVRFAHQIIVVTPAHLDHLVPRYGERVRRKTTYIPNGVTKMTPPAETQAEVLKKYGLEDGAYILGVGRFVKEKGLQDLVKAFGQMTAPPAKLVLAGEADYETPEAEAIREAARRDDRIILTGQVDAETLWSLYLHTGLFVLASHHEGMPLSLLEALACGAPVLATDLDTTRALPLPDERYTPVGDPSRLASRMQSLFGKPLAPEEKACWAKLFQEEFNWDTIANETVKVYRGVQRKNGRHEP